MLLSSKFSALEEQWRGKIVRQLKETWAVVLAGGEGARLRGITTNRQGVFIPKQYCSLGRSSCLLQDALMRARTVAMSSHVGTVVAAQHRKWWTPAVADLNESNIFVEPYNRGTAVGILFALLTLERQQPEATLILLPADHYFRDEEPVTRALRIAGNLACANTSSVYLLGADPDSPDPELGYILPERGKADTPGPIAGFTEKPDQDFAQELISLGALWNLFSLAGSVNALLQLFMEEHADTVLKMREALVGDAAGAARRLNHFYEKIEPLDFSRDILELQANRLHVIRVQNSGWTDLGTPKRVETTVRGLLSGCAARRERSAPIVPLFFDLGSQYS
jgi:mannose-1-phosphate guanylyltransferase